MSGPDTNQNPGPAAQSPASSSGSPWGKFALSSQMLVALVALMISIPILGSIAFSGGDADVSDSQGGDGPVTSAPKENPPAVPREVLLRGRWSGIADEVGGPRQERVRLRIVSFDGERDGTLVTDLDGTRCELELAWLASTARSERFEAFDLEGICATSIVRVAPARASLRYDERWSEQGRRVRFAGKLTAQ